MGEYPLNYFTLDLDLDNYLISSLNHVFPSPLQSTILDRVSPAPNCIQWM